MRESHQHREKELEHRGQGNRDRDTTRENRRNSTGHSRRWRSREQREKILGRKCINENGRDNSYSNEGNWTKGVSKRTAKERKKITTAERQPHSLRRGLNLQTIISTGGIRRTSRRTTSLTSQMKSMKSYSGKNLNHGVMCERSTLLNVAAGKAEDMDLCDLRESRMQKDWR